MNNDIKKKIEVSKKKWNTGYLYKIEEFIVNLKEENNKNKRKQQKEEMDTETKVH